MALHEYGVQTTNTAVNLLKTQHNYAKNANDLYDAFHSFFSIPDNSHDISFKTIADLRKAKVKARVYYLNYNNSITRKLSVVYRLIDCINFLSSRQS